MGKNILVFIPHGEVYDHDCVRAYDYQDIDRTIDRYYNMGDLFVYDSSLKLLDFDYVEPLKITSFSQENIDRYNAEFDYCFLRGSNYLHPHMQWEQAIPVLEKLKIPVIPFGIGAQAPKRGPLELSNDTKRVLKLLADKCTSIGVRGEYTAQVLSDLGIMNVDIIGCPTLFRHNDPALTITLPPLDEIKTLGYTLRREVDENYTSDVPLYMEIQRQMILDLAKRFDLTVMAQGETEEKAIFYNRTDKIPAAINNLVNLHWFRHAEDELLDLYKYRMFYSETVRGYDEFVRTQDMVLGFRLHGNLIALANGVPSVYCTYDSRTREFVDTYKIPSYDVDSGKPFLLEEYYDQRKFDAFNAAYRYRYQLMENFLSKNGMENKMQKLRHAA